jgi:glycine cleavage system H protein
MAQVPDDMKYTPEHEWVSVAPQSSEQTIIRVGITDFAQESLGDVVYVTLPQVGASVTKGESFGEVESTKSVSDLYAPATGTVATRNDKLDSQPDLINSDPYGEGWIVEIAIDDADQLDGLLDAAAYGTLAS